jgi:ribosomal protein S18 acetylase RimI-like enzyme
VVYDTPGCRFASFSHRLLVDAPPTAASLHHWREVWLEHHGEKGIQTSYVCWEQRGPEAIEGAFRLRCLMMDQEVDPPTAANIRAVDDHAALVELMVHVEGEESPDYRAYAAWYLRGLLDRCAKDQGQIFGWYQADQLVGIAGILWSDGEARMQAILVHEAHRRQGICSALVTACLSTYHDRSFGICYVVAEDGSIAESAFRTLGFRRVTCFFEYALPPQSTERLEP